MLFPPDHRPNPTDGMCCPSADSASNEGTANNPPLFTPPQHNAATTVVVIEELEPPHWAPRPSTQHHGMVGPSPSPPSPFSSCASTAVFDCWLDAPGESGGELHPGQQQHHYAHQHYSNNPLRHQHQQYAAFEQQQRIGGGIGPHGHAQLQQQLAMYTPNNPYYQHYQPARLVHQQQPQSAAGTPPSGALGRTASAANRGGTPPTAVVGGGATYVLRQHQRGRAQQRQQRDSLTPDQSVDEREDGGGGERSESAKAGEAERTSGTGHTARAAPETLEWLHANYEPHPGASLPRCTLYEHYQNHCRETRLAPVNAASFGKLIRSSFKGLETRRLGTRGNSKYHYSGIRIKPTSALAATISQEEFQRMNPAPSAHQQQHGAHGPRGGTRRQAQRRANSGSAAGSSGAYSSSDELHQQGQQIDVEELMDLEEADANGAPDSSAGEADGRPQQRDSRGQSVDFLLPSASPPTSVAGQRHQILFPSHRMQLPRVSLPLDDQLDEALLPLGLSVQHALKFQMDYETHQREVLECVLQMRLETVEHVWAGFWMGGGQQSANASGDRAAEPRDARATEELLPGGHQMRQMPALDRDALFRICSVPQVLLFIQRMDTGFYQLLLDQLMPDPVRSGGLANDLHQLPQVRSFAKGLLGWMDKALSEQAPPPLREVKLGCVQLLANAITRLSSFAHLAVTAREVLQSDEQMAQMHSDFAKVDLSVVHGQAEWACDWSPAMVQSLADELGKRLALRGTTLDEWADWLETLAARAIGNGGTECADTSLANGKRFLLSWTFYSSLVLRDFTLRSAKSFGQFHLVRLLFDEYLYIVVERRLAKMGGLPPIALTAPEWLQLPPRATPHCQLQQQQIPQSPTVNLAQQQPNAQTTYSTGVLSAEEYFPPTTTTSSAVVSYQQQQHIRHPQNPFVDHLPLPGPEPPLDMLTGIDEHGSTKGSSGGGTGQEGPRGGACIVVKVEREEEEEEGEEELGEEEESEWVHI